ncbi:MAG: response regulator transcription factor [Bacteroidota bacterium]|nr:response regulator transcription factor [Bacteroidota bacterium]
MTSKILIAIVDDKLINRNTFSQKVKLFDNLLITFFATDGNDCLEELKGLPFNKHPQIIFVDLEMPGLDGIQTIKIAKPLYPHINFIVLTVFDDDDKIFEAIQAGACGYLLKDESATQLYNAIEGCLQHGGAPMSPAIARKALNILGKVTYSAGSPSNISEVDAVLSEREKEILHHTIRGCDAKRISEIINISVLTVRKHISNIYKKLHVNSKAQIMNLAHQRKWF